MPTQIKFRRGNASQWAASNPILSLGEPGYDTTNRVFKIGDGVTPWSSLPAIAGSGPQGTQGIQGVQGNQGIQGVQGIQGLDGLYAGQGIQGDQGVQGTQGTQGLQGIQGESIQGIAGDQGEQGLQGTTGAQGITGNQGTQGIQGRQGTVGGIGSQGAQGTQGAQGSQGMQGLQGIQGLQGTQGTEGSQGLQGTTGAQGGQGTQGLQGIQGYQGNQGIQGVQGIIGTQGLDGLYAGQGIQGLQGTQGRQGIQGIIGYGLKIVGNVANSSQLPSSGNTVGDGYIVNSDGHLWTWDGSQWGDRGNVTGPQGIQGVQGAQGSQGTAGALSPWILKTANYTAVNGDRIIADTTAGSFTITLPASPTTGQEIHIMDGNDWSVNQINIARNGSTIEGVTENIISDNKGITIIFIYNGNSGVNTWQVTTDQGPTGSQGTTGSQGIQGLQGLQGIQGDQGLQGLQGTQGLQGLQGTQGIQGSQGTQGIQGPNSLASTATISGVVDVRPTVTNSTDGSLSFLNTTYYIRIYAYDSAGNYSAVKLNTSTFVDNTYTNNYGYYYQDEIQLSWGAIPNTSYYRIYFVSDSSSYTYSNYTYYNTYNDNWKYFQTTSTSYNLITETGATVGLPPNTTTQPSSIVNQPTTYDFTPPKPYTSTSGLKVEGDIITNGDLMANSSLLLTANSSMNRQASIKLDFSEVVGTNSNFNVYRNIDPASSFNNHTVLESYNITTNTPLILPGGILLGKIPGNGLNRGVELTASESTNPSYTFVLPASSGSNFQALTTYGNGVTTWSNVHGVGTILYRKTTATSISPSSTSVQSIFGLTNGILIATGTQITYQVRGQFQFITDGTTSHTEAFGFSVVNSSGGAAGLSTCDISVTRMLNTAAATGVSSVYLTSTTSSTTVVSPTIAAANTSTYVINGLITTSFNYTETYLNPMIKFSAATGGTVNGTKVSANSYIILTPMWISNATTS